MDDFTLCRHEVTGGEALLATTALPFWGKKGWRPVEPATESPAPKRGRKSADDAGDNKESE
jgi:hypothetical protein